MDEIDLVLGREAAVSFLFGEGVSFERFSDEFVDFTSCRTRFFSCFMNWSGLGIPLLPLSWLEFLSGKWFRFFMFGEGCSLSLTMFLPTLLTCATAWNTCGMERERGERGEREREGETEKEVGRE